MAITAYLAGLLGVFFYALLAPIAKKFLPSIPPFSFISITMLILAALSGVVAVFYEKQFSLAKLSLNNWGGLVIFSAVNFIGFIFTFMPFQKCQLRNIN